MLLNQMYYNPLKEIILTHVQSSWIMNIKRIRAGNKKKAVCCGNNITY